MAVSLSAPELAQVSAEESSFSLPLPSIEEAQFLTRELEWGEHLIGVEMNPAAGNNDIYMYSLKEVARFLREGTAGMGFKSGGRSTVSWVKVEELVEWARSCLQDPVLANALEDAIVDETTYYGQVQKLGRFLDVRYQQLAQLLEQR